MGKYADERAEKCAELDRLQAENERLREALGPFSNAFTRLESYGEPPHDTPLYACTDEDSIMFELLNGEDGDRLNVGTLCNARAALKETTDG